MDRIEKPCEECFGSGREECCYAGCGFCLGEGDVECEACEGTGITQEISPQNEE